MKKSYPVLLLVLGLLFIFGLPHPAQAAECRSNQTPFYVATRDADGVLAPGINFTIYEQYTDPDGNPYFGPSRGSGTTDAGGQMSVCATDSQSGKYAIKFYQYNVNYGYRVMWHNELVENTAEGGYDAYPYLTYVQVILRDGAGTLLKDIRFDIYVQEYDVDGTAIIGENKLNQEKLISDKYMTGVTGTARAYLTSTIEWKNGGIYVLRLHGTGSAHFLLWEQRLPISGVNFIEYKMSTLRVIQEDAYGNLLKNRKFSIYQQAYDAHGAQAYGSVIAENLDVGKYGYNDVYVPAGDYVMKVPSSVSGTNYTKWKIGVRTEIMNKLTYRLGGLRTTIFDGNKQLLVSQVYSIGQQGTTAVGQPTLVKTLISSNTGVLGYNDIYLVPGKYVFTYANKRTYNVEIFENQITVLDYPFNMSLRATGGEMALTTPMSNINLTIRPLPAADVRGISIRKKNVGTPFQVRADKIVASYTVVFFYNKEKLAARGINTDKLRIAFYNGRTKTWSLVGANQYSLSRLTARVRDAGIFTLIEIN